MTKKKQKTKKDPIPSKKEHQSNNNSIVAKQDDGTVQITFTIDKATVKQELDKTAAKLAETLEVKGFRKGKAPVEKVHESVDKNQLIQSTLNRIVPPIIDGAFKKHGLKPVMFPKVELLKADENSDWELRAITAEFPDITLGDYKTLIKNKTKSSDIWTPDKMEEPSGDSEKNKEKSQAQKEQEIMKILLENIKFNVPKVLVEEEVNARLAKLLDQIEKLGLNLESYLKSVGKNVNQLREEYTVQSRETLRLELILNKIAEVENIEVSDIELEPYLKQLETGEGLTEENKSQQVIYIRSSLKKRKVVDMLLSS